MGSVKSQVTHSLNALKAFGESRHQARRDETAGDKIFSVQTLHLYCELNVSFAEWCRAEHGIRRLADITPDMATDFIARLRRTRLSPATVSTYVCAMKKLDTGLRKVGWRRRDAERLVQDFQGRRADVIADPYPSDDAEQLSVALDKLDPQYGQVARLQRVAGLRVSEAVHLQADWIAPDGSAITLSGSGTHAKGGRPRRIPILPQHREMVVALREQGMANPDHHVFQHRQSLTGAVKRAASALAAKLGIEAGHGTHSLRKTYANELYQHLMQEQHLSRDTARQMVTQALGHNRLAVLKAYLLEDNDE